MRGRRNRLVTMSVAATLALCVAQPSAAATYGLVVGIDDYECEPTKVFVFWEDPCENWDEVGQSPVL